MNGRNEDIEKLYTILDRPDDENEFILQDKYLGSVYRRLYSTRRKSINFFHRKKSEKSDEQEQMNQESKLLRPEIKIRGGLKTHLLPHKEEKSEMKKEEEEKKVSREDKKKEEEVSVTKIKEETKKVRGEILEESDELFEVEKLSEEELKEIIGRERILKVEKPAEVEEKKTERRIELGKEKFIEILSSVKGIGKRKAKMLYESGYTSLDKIIETDSKQIAEEVRGISEDLAKKLKKEVMELQPKIAKDFDQMYLLEEESVAEKAKLERKIAKAKIEFKEELPEWVTIDKGEEPWKEEKRKPYKYEDYTLYKVEKKGLTGRKITYVFSKEPVEGGTPSPIPPGYVVKINKKGIPSLKRIE